MGNCGSGPSEAKSAERGTQRLIKTDVGEPAPWEGPKKEVHEIPEDELAARVFKRMFLLLTGLFYTVISGLVLVVPGSANEGFPLYLPPELVADKVALNFLEVALVATFLRGIGYFTLAGNNYEEIMFASIFNKLAMALFAGMWWSSGQMPTSLFFYVMVGDFGSMMITLLLMLMYPETLRRQRRVLLFFVPPKIGRPIRAYFLEAEGYFQLVLYLLLTIPLLARMFENAPHEWVGKDPGSVGEMAGIVLPPKSYRLGMFQIACFWMANMYWYYIPAGRRASKGVMAMARQQRLFMIGWWIWQHYVVGDNEHNLLNLAGTLAFLFLFADVYNKMWHDYFSPIGDDEHDSAPNLEDGGTTSSYLVFVQAQLSYQSRWVLANAGNLAIVSQVWMWFSSTGLPFIHYTYQFLPGHMELAYKLHVTDYSLVFLYAILALVIFPLVPSHPTSQLVLKAATYCVPLLGWWYALQAKSLMHLNGGSPWFQSWFALGIGTLYTDICVDYTFWLGFLAFKVVAVLILAAVALYAIGSPLSAVAELGRALTTKEAAAAIKKVSVQHATMLIVFSGFWMFIACSGLSGPNKSNGIAWAPAPVGSPLAAEIHRYDILLALALPLGGSMLGESTSVAYAKAGTALLVVAAWLYALAVKISAHAGSAASFHQSWVDQFGVPAFANTGADVFSWLAFVLLNFVAFPVVAVAVLRGSSLNMLRARNPRAQQMTTPELLSFNRGVFFTHAVLLMLVSGAWAILTSSGLWGPAGKTGALFGSFPVANPPVLKVSLVDLVSVLTFGCLGLLLDYVPVNLPGQRERIDRYTWYVVVFVWVYTLVNKLMANVGEDDLLTWPGLGAFGEWRDPLTLSLTHNFVDVVWYVATLLGRAALPIIIFFLIRNSIANFSHSLAARFQTTVHKEPEEEELYFGVLYLQLLSNMVTGTRAYKALEWLSHVVSPPERQYLTVDRIAYSMQEPSKTLRRKYFSAVGVAKDEHGWWFCSEVPEEIDQFQRNEILAAMSAHTIQKDPRTFYEIMRARAFHAAPDWMVWQPLTDELFNDIFHSRFGAELIRKTTAEELKNFNASMQGHVGANTEKVQGNTAASRLRGGAMRAVVTEQMSDVVVCDLTLLLKDAQRKPPDHCYPTPAMKFYFTANELGIKVRAIEMLHITGKDEFYYANGSPEWDFAKRVASSALITAHQIGVHLTHGHFLAESQVVLAYKWLHVDHWIFKWIEPLAGDVQFINETWGKEAILYGTIMDMGPCTTEGLAQIITNAKTIAFEGDDTWHLMKRLQPAYSGVPDKCPWNYRLTATILEGFVRTLATAVADKFYNADDLAMKNFMKSVYWWRPAPSATPTTKAAVIEYMVEFFMNTSYRHDYAHDDYLWHVAKSLPPQIKPAPNPLVPASYLPSKEVYAMTLQIAHALQAGVIETPLEAYYAVYPEPDMRPAVETFVSQVQSLLVLGGPHEHMNQCGSMTH